MSNLKVAGGLLAGVLVLLAAALIALWLLVNPNQYKSSIIAQVKQSTGRDLTLPGDIKLTLFPWAAFEFGPASLGNPPGFSAAPLLTLTHASLRVRLLPLLRRRLKVSRIEIDGLDVHLFKNEDGRGNWQSEPASEIAAVSPAVTASQPSGWDAELRLRDARISYRNVRIEHLDLESGAVGRNLDIPVSATFTANRGTPGESLTVTAKFDVSDNSAAGLLRLAAVNVSGTLDQRGDGRPAHWEVTSPVLDLNVAEQSVAAGAFSLSYSNAHLTGSLRAKNILDDLNVTGSMTLMPLVLHEFAPRLGVTLPLTPDSKALSQFSGAADVSYALNTLRLTKLEARLDDTQLQGSLDYSRAEAPSLKFDLGADHIDIDRYRGLREANPDKPEPSADRGATAKSSLEVSGTLNVAQATLGGREWSHLHLIVTSKDRLTHFFPLQAEIDGGRYSGDITVDERGADRVVSLDEHLAGVDLTRLLGDGAHKRHLSGRATLNFKGLAHGASADALLKTLNGHLDADLSNGAFEGIDLPYDINRAQMLLERGTVPRDDTGRTTFDQFKLSAQVTDGIAATDDLTIASEALKVTGQGSANLSTKAIHFALKASLQKGSGTSLIDVPVDVTGTYSDPAVKANITAVAKEQLKQKLQDVLKKNGLQGLFSK